VATKRNKVTVLLSIEEFRRFEAYCEQQGYKKSTLIARLIREHLDAERFAMQSDLPLQSVAANAGKGSRRGED